MRSFDRIKEFPLFKKAVYMNFGSSGPVPASVVNRMHSHLLLQSETGPSSPKFMENYLNEYVILRKRLASLLNVSDKEIAITQNTTEGINIVLRGMQWAKNDEIITTDSEHPGLTVPLAALESEFGAVIRRIKASRCSREEIVNAIKEATSTKTRLIALSHVDYIYGRRMPVKEIALLTKKRNIPILVDGAQAVGSIPVDVMDLGCDFYAFPAHKWLLGPRGSGCLYVADKYINKIRPIFTGWCSVNEISPYAVASVHKRSVKKNNGKALHFAKGAGKFALSTWSTIGVAGFLESLNFFQRFLEAGHKDRLRDIEDFKCGLAGLDRITLLTPPKEEDSAGIVTVRIDGAASFDIARKLIGSNVIVRHVPESDGVRFCVSAVNSADDLKKAHSAVKRIIMD